MMDDEYSNSSSSDADEIYLSDTLAAYPSIPGQIVPSAENLQEFFAEADDDSNLSANMELMDTDGEHLYLGQLNRVSGFNYLEPYQYFKIILLKEHLLVYPGEIIPIILPRHMATFIDDDQEDGLLFGIVFTDIDEGKSKSLLGVTCQIYERGINEDDNFVIKARACQRFIVPRKVNESFPFDDISLLYHTRTYVNVFILPEIILPDPQHGETINSCTKFRKNPKMSKKIRRFETGSLAWPSFVYDQYDVDRAIAKIIDSLPATIDASTVPKDLTMLSFWFAKNILLDAKERTEIFRTNSAVNRIFKIQNSIDSNTKYFSCKKCKAKIATYSLVFTMSKKGVQSNYCNPSGAIHELNTVYNVLENTVVTHGRPSTQFSWFPGYAWQILLCARCSSHLGWKFIHLAQMGISTFYGLSGSSILISRFSSS